MMTSLVLMLCALACVMTIVHSNDDVVVVLDMSGDGGSDCEAYKQEWLDFANDFGISDDTRVGVVIYRERVGLANQGYLELTQGTDPLKVWQFIYDNFQCDQSASDISNADIGLAYGMDLITVGARYVQHMADGGSENVPRYLIWAPRREPTDGRYSMVYERFTTPICNNARSFEFEKRQVSLIVSTSDIDPSSFRCLTGSETNEVESISQVSASIHAIGGALGGGF